MTDFRYRARSVVNTRFRRSASVVLAVLLGGAVGCGRATAYGGVELSASPLMRSLDREAMIRASTAAVAVVETDVGRGMAFVVDPDGYLITNRHVVEDAEHVEALIFPNRDPQRRFESVQVEYVDPVRDLALLRVRADEPMPYLPLATAKVEPVTRYVSHEDPVVLLAREAGGRPADPGLEMRRGTVDRLRVVNPAAGPTAYLGVSGDIVQGQSGGPVLDRHGRAVGIVTWTWRGHAGGFAIPITDVTRMLAERPRLDDAAALERRARSRVQSFTDALLRDDLEDARRLTSPSHARKVREASVARILPGTDVSDGLRRFVASVEALTAGKPPEDDEELEAALDALERLVAETADPGFRASLGVGAELRNDQLWSFFRELGRAYYLARLFGEQPPTEALMAALRRLRTVDAARTFAVADARRRLGDGTPQLRSLSVVPGAYAPRAVADLVVDDDDGPPRRVTVHLRLEWGDWYVAEVTKTALSETG